MSTALNSLPSIWRLRVDVAHAIRIPVVVARRDYSGQALARAAVKDPRTLSQDFVPDLTPVPYFPRPKV